MSAFSKLVICAMMIRGRHRMLPNQLDRAIMLPESNPTEPETVPERQPLMRGDSGERNFGGFETA